MIGVFIVPTGIGAEIGGHAGDANPAVKLIAKCCDKLITHPNAVNASDINEMPENVLYVEGSSLDRFLEESIELKEVKTYNKILLVVNAPLKNETINAVSTARVTIGCDIRIIVLDKPLRMVSKMENGVAKGIITGTDSLVAQVCDYACDALAIQSHIEVDGEVALKYFREGGTNPWGGVEAMASKMIATELDKPVAHAPLCEITREDEELYFFNEVVDPRMAPEMISTCYLHCIFKGLHKAPRIVQLGNGSDLQVDFMITPVNCVGPPHHACLKRNIPVIAVKENRTVLNDRMPDEFIVVENYLEAAGLIMAMKAGVMPASVRSPVSKIVII